MNFKQIENTLTHDNWKLIRILGSNYQYRKAGHSNSIIIPNYGNHDIPIDVVKNLEKITGLSLLR